MREMKDKHGVAQTKIKVIIIIHLKLLLERARRSGNAVKINRRKIASKRKS